MKAALLEAKKPKDIDVTLPEWGRGGAAHSKKKRKRFTVKAPSINMRVGLGFYLD